MILLGSARAGLLRALWPLLRWLVRPFLRFYLSRAERVEVSGFHVLYDPADRPLAADIVCGLRNALELIQRHYPIAYRRMAIDMPDIYVTGDRSAHYLIDLKVCVLPVRQVLGGEAGTLAFRLVHEATHARLANLGIGWWPGIRPRIEKICIGRERRFADHLERAGFQVADMRKWLDNVEDALAQPPINAAHE